ncbi:MAG: hypothetical protein NXH72_08730 [Hyphomonadaceae bacterium]|nr:hypothetical protein [Hyphomonadaceae bacterium]
MAYAKLIWSAVLIVAFIAFSVWYGGNGKPISAAEGARLMEQFETIHGAPADGEESFVPNVREMIEKDDGKEFYAVNLERLKPGPEAQAADRTYAGIVMPLLFKRASHPVFVSNRVGLMLGDYGDQVDRVAVVRYRSLRDMIEMASEPAMVEGGSYKFAALEHTEVFVTRPFISFMQIRLLMALFLIVIGFMGWKAIDLMTARRHANA